MKRLMLIMSVFSVLIVTSNRGFGDDLPLNLGPKEIIQANGVDIEVPGYSVPSYVDWDNDGKNDLIVGEGGNWQIPGIRVYLNEGTPSQPQFSDYFYVSKAEGGNIGYVGHECICSAQGLFPRVVYWDADEKKDLLVGQHDGKVILYRNIGEDANPVFDSGAFLQVGEAGSRVDIDVNNLAAPAVIDWDSDSRKDLVLGALDGRIYIFLNEGTDTQPDFLSLTFAQEDSSDLVVHPLGSSPLVLDLDGDGKKDLLIGDTAGQLSFYSNVGTDAAPAFSGYSLVESDGHPIQVDAITGASPRARPYITDWTGDGYFDVLVGAGDGKVYLYQGVPEITTLLLLGLGDLALLRKRQDKLPK